MIILSLDYALRLAFHCVFYVVHKGSHISFDTEFEDATQQAKEDLLEQNETHLLQCLFEQLMIGSIYDTHLQV